MPRITEQDEFLLSRLLDGDLGADEAAALRARVAREPDLRAALERMERLNTLLVARREMQPQVDYAGLRGGIMDAVHASRRPSVIRFPLWTWAAGAVAAAAAIAIVFVAYRPAGPVAGPMIVETNPQPVVSPQQPDVQPAPQRPTMLVQFNRPRHASQPSAVKVNYVRSDQLAGEMIARDRERRSRPTWHTYVAQRARTPSGPASPFDLPL